MQIGGSRLKRRPRITIPIMDMKSAKSSASVQGSIAAFAAYGIWGLFPLYWKRLESAEPLQILSHRIFWAGLFCLLLLSARGVGSMKSSIWLKIEKSYRSSSPLRL